MAVKTYTLTNQTSIKHVMIDEGGRVLMYDRGAKRYTTDHTLTTSYLQSKGVYFPPHSSTG